MYISWGPTALSTSNKYHILTGICQLFRSEDLFTDRISDVPVPALNNVVLFHAFLKIAVKNLQLDCRSNRNWEVVGTP